MTKAQRKKFIKKAFSGTEVMVLLEDMRDDTKFVAEQHGDIIKKIDNISKELNDFRIETRANFEAIQEYLSRIENDFLNLRKKVDILETGKVNLKDFEWIKNKVLDIEKQLREFKKQQTALAAKI